MIEPAIYIVATPIGNLADITFRAIDILKSVDIIAAEDTRHSKKLLQHYNVQTSVIAFHEHNEDNKYQSLLDLVKQGKSIAIISDAGTPLISDPGYKLVSNAKASNIKVIPIPGPSALIAALSASGLPTDSFNFIGFLPTKSKLRQEALQGIFASNNTSIFYEAPHRIISTVKDIAQLCHDQERKICLAREISKKFETITTIYIKDALSVLSENNYADRGEFVVLLEGAKKTSHQDLDIEAQNIVKVLASELPTKQAASIGAKLTGIHKNIIYDYVINIK